MQERAVSGWVKQLLPNYIMEYCGNRESFNDIYHSEIVAVVSITALNGGGNVIRCFSSEIY